MSKNKYHIRIGEAVDDGAPVFLDLRKLVETRMLVEASSGSGKSMLIRLIAERAAGLVQTIILDHEDEFPTLRKVLDVLLVGDERDVPIDTRSAALLARRLAELRISAVVNLYDLVLPERREFVGAFLDALLNTPKTMWHPMLIMLDEAHIYCPEKGDAPSRAAVVNMMSQGRKREYCEIVATQRFSKIDKDAIADAKNVFIGGTFLDLDQKRAGDMLGMKSSEYVTLRDLAPGEWYAFGQALISDRRGVIHFRADLPVTKKPESGGQHFVVPKASEVISSLVEQLGDLPQQAQEEQDALVTAQREVVQLRRELAQRPVQVQAAAPEVKIEYVEKPVLNGEVGMFLDGVRQLETLLSPLMRLSESIAPLANNLTLIQAKVDSVRNWQPPAAANRAPAGRIPTPPIPARRTPSAAAPDAFLNGSLPKGEELILKACAQYADGCTRQQLTALTGYKRSSRDAYIARLAQKGYINTGARITATESGIAVLGANFEPLPTGIALQEHWLANLPEGERVIFEIVMVAYPEWVERTRLDDVTPYKRSSRDAYIARLAAKEIIEARSGAIKASDILFGN